MLAHAGFSERGQIAFAVLAASAALTVAVADPESFRAALRVPIVLIILAIAALTALSAAWTIGDPAAALRWGCVVAGYTAMAISGFSAAKRNGAEGVAELIVLLAVVAAAVGLIAAAVQEQPYAERIGGAWRPGGPFEYPPALGALQLAALPVALRGMVGGGRAVGWSAVVVVIAATIALISSRAVLALGALILLGALAAPRSTLRVGRPLALAAVGFTVAAACAGDALAGSYAEPYVATDDLPRLAGLSALVVFAPLLWKAIRGRFGERGALRPGARTAACLLVAVPLVASIAAAASTPDSGTGVEPDAGVTHGRVELWGDAVSTAAGGPFEGTGALTFFVAAVEAGNSPDSVFAHDFVLEQWVELGYPGLLLGIALVATAIASILRARRSPAGWLIGVGAGVFGVAMLIDWPWHVPAAGAVFALLLGGLAAADRIAAESAPSGLPRDRTVIVGSRIEV